MKKDQNELNNLFSNTQLEPDSAFENKLAKKLNFKPKKSHRISFAKVGFSFVAALLIVGLGFIIPSSNKVNNFVLVKDLYSIALADELPVNETVNFWQLNETLRYGKQAPLCVNTDFGQEVVSTTLLYNNKAESAVFTKSTDPYIFPYMRYSTDPEILAYDEVSYFGGEKSSLVSQYLNRATLTDEKGNTLTEDAKVEKKEDGEYSIYAKINTEKDDYKNFVEGCNDLVIKVYIDAKDNMFKGVDIYNTKDFSLTDEEHLSFSREINVTTSYSETFSGISNTFVKEGFDMAEAELTNSQNDYVTVLNKEAGYEFAYKKSLLGTANLTPTKNLDGEILSYLYEFSKEPSVRLELFTNLSEIDLDIDTRIQNKNLSIIDDYGSWTNDQSDFGSITSRIINVKNDTTKYSLHLTGAPYIVFVEVEAPLGLGEYTKYDDYAPDFPIQIDDVLTLSSVAIFKQNGEPPQGL